MSPEYETLRLLYEQALKELTLAHTTIAELEKVARVYKEAAATASEIIRIQKVTIANQKASIEMLDNIHVAYRHPTGALLN